MKRIVVVIAALLLTTNAFALEMYEPDWSSLEKALLTFLDDPNEENAKQFTDHLPPGKQVTRLPGDIVPGLPQTLFLKIKEIEKLVEGGNVHAYEVVFAWTEIAERHEDGWLSKIIGEGIIMFPQEYLTAVKERLMLQTWRRMSPCLDAFRVEGDPEQYSRAVEEERVKAIKSITDPVLHEAQSCALNVLSNSEPMFWLKPVRTVR